MNALVTAPPQTAAPIPLNFHPRRVKTRLYGDQVFVVDRLSGRWLFAPAEKAPSIRQVTDAEHGTRFSGDGEKWVSILSHEGIGADVPEKNFDALRMLILKLTDACHLRCTVCYSYEDLSKARVLDETQARNAIEQSLELCPDILQVLLHGGEPLLVWPLIERLVEFAENTAARLGKRVEFTGQSSFTRLTDRIVDFSREHQIRWGLSLDGDAGINDQIRVDHKGRGTYHQVMQALHTWPTFVRAAGVMATITRVNAHRLLDVARHIRSLDFTGFDWSLFQPIGRARHRPEFGIDTAVLAASWKGLFEAVLSGEFDGFTVQPVKKYIDQFFFGATANMCLRPKCGAGRDLMSLSANGTIEACDCIDPTRADISDLGNARDTSIGQARQSVKAQNIRARDMSEAPDCSTCPWYSMCGGTCLAYASTLDDKSPLYCAMSKSNYDAIAAEVAGSGDRIIRYLASLECRPS